MNIVNCENLTDSYTQAEKALESVVSEICDIIQGTRRELGLSPTNMQEHSYDNELAYKGHPEEAHLYSVYHTINEIRGFLRKAVEYQIFLPVMLMEENEKYAEKIRQILQTYGVDYKEVDISQNFFGPPRLLIALCERIGKIKNYIADLTINSKRIIKITPVSERIVYGEGAGILILEDSAGQKSILKFVVGNNEQYLKLLNVECLAGRITHKEHKERCYNAHFMYPLNYVEPYHHDPADVSCRLTHEGDVLTSIEDIDGVPKIYARGLMETHDGYDLRYMVIEYFEGNNLVNLVKTKNLPPQKIIQIISSLLRILNTLHGKGYIHRDISVSNVLITDDGEIRLIDFGGAELIGSVKSNDERKMAGTWPYIPPETSNYYDEEKFRTMPSLVDITTEIGEERDKAYEAYRTALEEGEMKDRKEEDISAEFYSKQRACNRFNIWREIYCPLNPEYNVENDIYAVGILLYRLLKGEGCATDLDFGQVRLNNLANIHEGMHNQTLALQPQQARKQLADVIEKATRLDYRTRYKSANEMLTDLEAIQLV